jgi:hypothetical protein
MLLIGVISIASVRTHTQTISIAGDKGGIINETFTEALRAGCFINTACESLEKFSLFCCCKPCSNKPVALTNH